MRFTYSQRKMAKIFANSGDPDQMPHSVVSDLGLHCLTVTLLPVSRLQWVSIGLSKYFEKNCYYLNTCSGKLIPLTPLTGAV